jgi:hypothetical protein
LHAPRGARHATRWKDRSMTSADDAPSSAAPARDAVRIVPLAVPGQLLRPLARTAPAAPVRMTYRDGPLLTSVEVFVVYWGTAWAGQPLADTASRVDSFFDTVLTGEVMDQLSEYGVEGQPIGRGRRVGRAVVSAPDPGPVVTDAALQQMLRDQLVTNSSFPAVDRNTLLFVYLPPGTAVVQGGSRSCQAFCGYHDVMDADIFYAVVPYPGCQGCTGTLSAFDALTAVSSHELCEAVTDPVPGQGWYDDANGEIGDVCAWQTRAVGGYTVQREWSNSSSSCR